MEAHLASRRKLVAATIIFGAIALWTVHHVITTYAAIRGYDTSEFYWAYLFTFTILAIMFAMAHKEKTYQSNAKDEHEVVVIVPAYNEDPQALRDGLRSMFHQTRVPQEIFVVDDGSTAVDYTSVRRWFKREAKKYGIKASWKRVAKNQGKRHAQAVAVKATPDATIYVTVDSDSWVDTRAFEEGLKPFADKTVQSVAGVILARNNTANFLARFTDLLFVTGQLTDRSMMSSVGSVLVNSGGLALYRSEVIRDNLDAYLNETFFGRRIEFSDDSMLTLFALQGGAHSAATISLRVCAYA